MSLPRFLPPPAAGALLAVVVWSWASPAYTYIDPTAASAALQSLYVVAASALMTLAVVPRKVASALARLKAWFRPGAQPPPDVDT